MSTKPWPRSQRVSVPEMLQSRAIRSDFKMDFIYLNYSPDKSLVSENAVTLCKYDIITFENTNFIGFIKDKFIYTNKLWVLSSRSGARGGYRLIY